MAVRHEPLGHLPDGTPVDGAVVSRAGLVVRFASRGATVAPATATGQATRIQWSMRGLFASSMLGRPSKIRSTPWVRSPLWSASARSFAPGRVGLVSVAGAGVQQAGGPADPHGLGRHPVGEEVGELGIGGEVGSHHRRVLAALAGDDDHCGI